MNILPTRRELEELNGFKYRPFGWPRTRDVFESFYPNSAVTDIKVLILSHGELHNTLKIISSQNISSQTIHIHINEPKNHLMNIARSILILKISSAFTPEPDNQDHEYLWSVWYNACWSKETAVKFQRDVSDLLSDGFPTNITVSSAEILKGLKLIWENWLICLEKNLSNSTFTSEILSQRSKTIQDMLKYRNLQFELKSASNAQVTDACLLLTSVKDYPEALRNRIISEESDYLRTGNTWPSDCNNNKTYINPTLLKPDATNQWLVDPAVCPFNDYIPLPIGELERLSHEEGFLSKHCQKKFKLLLSACRRQMEKVNVIFHVGNPLELCYSAQAKFHAVYCSSPLAEEMGLANVINAAGRVLSEEPETTLVIEVSRSEMLRHMDASHYVEEALCVPLSVMPSLFGLRLFFPTDRIGESLPNDFESSHVCLILKRTPPFRDIKLQVQSSWATYFEKLSKKCFTFQDYQPEDDHSLKTYTPLTYFFTLQAAAERAGRGNEPIARREILNRCHPFFKLSARTIIQWMWITKSFHIANSLKVSIASIEKHLSSFANVKLYSGSVQFDEIDLYEFFEKRMINRAPSVRLILLPTALLSMLDMRKPISWHLIPEAHCMDNVRLELTKSLKHGSGWIRFSFPLISDHGLSETHSVVFVDFPTGIFLASIGLMEHLLEEPFNQVNPFANGGPDLPEEILGSLPGGYPLFVQSCIEADNFYQVFIYSEYALSKKGFKISTDAQQQCRSAHRLILTQEHPADMRTLSFELPHPFYSEQVGIRYLSDSEAELTLFKALDEPWPSEFAVQTKWCADYLPSWPMEASQKSRNDSSDLFVHLDRQFDAPSKTLDPYPFVALDQVRKVISAIFELVVKEGHSFMTVRCLDSENVSAQVAIETEPDWLIRVDWTARCSPQGVPLLLISAFDHQRALELIGKKETTADEIENEAVRLFYSKIPDETVVNSFLLCSREAASLFRYILRLNSTKIKPSKSQIKDKISTENSPWIATFLAPRYSPRAPSAAEIGSATLMRSTRLKCAYCKRVQEKLTRCQGCGVSHYCSTECQQADLDDHLLVCGYLGRLSSR